MNTLASLILDPYERAARLAPALIAILPLLLLAVITSILSQSVITQAMTVFSACGVIFMLSNIARMLGKAREVDLYEIWGGLPTTQLLRHRENQIDRITKQRYHAFLERKIKASFPSPQEEQLNPERADEFYQAGVKWLLSKTRDKKRFPLLAKENISYGFHRNGYGMRAIGLVCAAISIVYLVVKNRLINPSAEILIQWPLVLQLPSNQTGLLIIYLAFVMLWTCYFTRSRVKQAAFAYAEMLLRSCDALR